MDTPGHADFGGEVERILGMVDGVLLLVDAFDGPQAQTRFVLKKALAPRPEGRSWSSTRSTANTPIPHEVHDKVLELLLELNATEEQFNAPFIYASARDGYAIKKLGDKHNGMTPLFEAIVKHVPAPGANLKAPFPNARQQSRLERLRRPHRHRQDHRRPRQSRRLDRLHPQGRQARTRRRDQGLGVQRPQVR